MLNSIELVLNSIKGEFLESAGSNILAQETGFRRGFNNVFFQNSAIQAIEKDGPIFFRCSASVYPEWGGGCSMRGFGCRENGRKKAQKKDAEPAVADECERFIAISGQECSQLAFAQDFIAPKRYRIERLGSGGRS